MTTAKKKPHGEARAAREKHEKDLRDMQERHEELRQAGNRPAEVHTDITVGDDARKVGEVHASGGRVFVDIDGEFSKDDMATLQQVMASAFQAVS